MSVPRHSLVLALGALSLCSCEHEREWRSRARFAPSHGPVAAPVAPVADAVPEPPCTDEWLLRRWRYAARPGRLCELLPRVRANYLATAQMPSWGIPNSTRATMRDIVEKCRAELRFTGRFMDFYSIDYFLVLISPSGAIVLGTPRFPISDNPFERCVIRWIERRSATQAEGDLLEVTVPPFGLRWWPDTRTPWLTQSLVW